MEYLEKIKLFLDGRKNMIMASVFLGFAVSFALAYISTVCVGGVQAGISSKVLRFHILADSDSKDEQELKLALRDAIFEEFGDEMAGAASRGEAMDILSGKLGDIEAFSERFVAERGFDHSVRAELVSAEFPTREYGNLIFPPGEYEALRVVIGSGEGQNFWCVMFPPLCFVDAARAEPAEKSVEDLRYFLSDKEFDIITKDENNKVKLRFKLVELWQELTSNGRSSS